jgi:hypothetical protein
MPLMAIRPKAFTMKYWSAGLMNQQWEVGHSVESNETILNLPTASPSTSKLALSPIHCFDLNSFGCILRGHGKLPWRLLSQDWDRNLSVCQLQNYHGVGGEVRCKDFIQVLNMVRWQCSGPLCGVDKPTEGGFSGGPCRVSLEQLFDRNGLFS